MRLLSIFFISALVLFNACTTQNTLLVTNSYPFDVKIHFDNRGDLDSTTIPANMKTAVVSKSLQSSSQYDDYTLRTLSIQDSTLKQLGIYRFSNSYLKSQNWQIDIPFSKDDTIPLHSLDTQKYFDMAKGETLLHVAEEYYNAGQIDKCMYLLDGYGQSGAFEFNIKRLGKIKDITLFKDEREKILSYEILLYLSLKKLNFPSKGKSILELIDKYDHETFVYLLSNDPEFSK